MAIDFTFTDEHEELRTTVRAFLREKSDEQAVREHMATERSAKHGGQELSEFVCGIDKLQILRLSHNKVIGARIDVKIGAHSALTFVAATLPGVSRRTRT